MKTVYVIIDELPETITLYYQEFTQVDKPVLDNLYKYCGSLINYSPLKQEEEKELAELIETVKETFIHSEFFSSKTPLKFERGDLMFYIGAVPDSY